MLIAALDLAASEIDHRVLASLARMLGTTQDKRAIPAFLRLADHPDEDVRFSVARWMPACCEAPGDEVLNALVTLSTDADDDVRDWATFALGTSLEVDGPAIRAALWARLDDVFAEAREEAILGLARRRDPRITTHVAELLDQGSVAGHAFSAIACLGDPALVPYLQEYEEEDVSEALRECDPKARAARDDFAAQLIEAVHARLPDLDFGVYGERFEAGLTLTARRNQLHWSVEMLLDRVAGDAVRAAGLIAGDLGGGESGS
ncbi:HEAT repeat domain-containing protein [Streptosporangiaceae bacterium NEAU-GS5]|nr:HEAT repeat domain-containing protein [Streptosporangiaceae bacterium NEAU-GS5]